MSWFVKNSWKYSLRKKKASEINWHKWMMKVGWGRLAIRMHYYARVSQWAASLASGQSLFAARYRSRWSSGLDSCVLALGLASPFCVYPLVFHHNVTQSLSLVWSEVVLFVRDRFFSSLIQRYAALLHIPEKKKWWRLLSPLKNMDYSSSCILEPQKKRLFLMIY
jgi:hypothetical protein